MAWHVVIAKPGQEAKAEKHLIRQGYETFLPRCGKRAGKADDPVPLFPRYLFVRLAPEQGWTPIKSTIGVSSLVVFGESLAIVPEYVIENIRKRVALGGGVVVLEGPTYKIGQRLRLKDSVFRDLSGLYAGSGKARNTLLLDMLGGKRLEVPAAMVEPV